MKNLSEKLIPLLKKGSCTPQISVLAKKLGQPATTIHYNIKKLEREKAILSYKAVFDGKRIGEGFTVFALLSLSPDEYGDPERVATVLSSHPEVESVDICTGDWEAVIKIKTKDQDSYFQFIKRALSMKGIIKIKSLTSLKQVKTEFVTL